MASIRNAIVDVVIAALNASGKPASLTVHQQRSQPIDADVGLPATVVYLFKEAIGSGTQDGDVSRQLRLMLEHRVEANAGGGTDETTDGLIDPLLTWGTQALFADQTLGGYATKLEEVEIQWVTADTESGRDLGAARQEFRVTYSTMEDDPETQP